MANTLNVISWTVRGLNSRLKHSLVFDYIKRFKPHIILLQENHLQGSRVLALKQANIMKVIHGEYSTYSRGVMILVTKQGNAHILHIKTDVKGRYVDLVCKIFNVCLTLVCV